MDAYYEESAINRKEGKERKIYAIINVFSYIFLVLGIILLINFIFNMPFKGLSSGASEETQQLYAAQKSIAIFSAFFGVFFLLQWFLLLKLKARYNVSYDYVFVSGELRISKVFNVNRRKLIARIDCADILQVGDVDNSAYERLRSDPSTQEIVCTANNETMSDKFFMYILANISGKKLYVLECRETLLLQMMKFMKRTVLESDYVPQEKKQKSV